MRSGSDSRVMAVGVACAAPLQPLIKQSLILLILAAGCFAMDMSATAVYQGCRCGFGTGSSYVDDAISLTGSDAKIEAPPSLASLFISPCFSLDDTTSRRLQESNTSAAALPYQLKAAPPDAWTWPVPTFLAQTAQSSRRLQLTDAAAEAFKKPPCDGNIVASEIDQSILDDCQVSSAGGGALMTLITIAAVVAGSLKLAGAATPEEGTFTRTSLKFGLIPWVSQATVCLNHAVV